MKKKLSPLLWLGVFLLLSAALWLADKYAFQYMEQKQTFFADAGYLRYIFSQLGGFATLLSALIVQFFVSPLSGTLITAAVLTLAAYLGADVLEKVSGRKETALLAILPSLGCIVQVCDMSFQYFGIVAHVLMLLCLCGYVRIERDALRLVAGSALTLALFAAAGSVAMLFAASALLIEIFKRPKKAAMFIIMPALAGLAGLIALRAGWAAQGRHVFGPYAYYTLRLQLPSKCVITWALWGSALLVSCIAGLFKTEKKAFGITLGAVGTLAVCCTAFFAHTQIKNADKAFRELYVLAGDEQWEMIIERCVRNKPNNLLLQNYLGVALAEKGLLSSKTFEFPYRNISGLYVESNKTPYVNALLSDVFFSMGEIGLAQRYALEANESCGNYSVRQLKRLTVTNLAFGAYEVAEKYIALLEKTLFYKGWAKEYRGMLYNEGADNALVASKRKCIFPENKLSGLGGLDIDFKRIIRANPEHTSTMQYLGTLLLLMKDVDAFMELMDEFYGTEALPEVLQPLFQQAICLYSNGDEEILQKYNIQQDTIDAYAEFKQKPKNWRSTYWYFYFYVME